MMFGVYIHIPFCIKKCNYCDFLSYCGKEEDVAMYIQALQKEIKAWSKINGYNGSKDTISSIYFGGGTPSSISSVYIEEIMKTLKESYYIEKDAEITIECNPGTVNEIKFSSYYNAGINRISMGLQSANNDELKKIGRIHTLEEFISAYQMAGNAGFKNISIDIMSALPNQTIQSYKNTLETVVKLNPEHISSYSLIIEEDTPFYKMYQKGELVLPSEEEERDMYYLTSKFLEEHGYFRYEISNYAKEGKESKHNSSYWSRKDYLGFGLGASSFLQQTRFQNTRDMKEYLENADKNRQESLSFQELLKDYKEIEILSPKEQMEEFMFLGLRMMKGVLVREFEKIFDKSFESIYGKVCQKLESEKLIKQNNGRIMLTEKGIDVSNYVLREFLL